MAAPIEERVDLLEKQQAAQAAALEKQATEVLRIGAELSSIQRQGFDGLRDSRHDIEIGVELQVAKMREETNRKLQDIIDGRRVATASSAWFQKENRALAFGLAVLLVICWLVSRVVTDATGIVVLVGGLLTALAGFWAALNRGQERARKDSIAPGPPDGHR